MNPQYLFSLFCFLCSFNLMAQLPYEGAAADRIVPGAKSILIEDQSSIPTFVVMEEDHLIPVQDFEKWERRIFKYDSEVSFVHTKTVKGKTGLTHQFRKQVYRGIPVEHALSVIHSKEGMVTYFNGTIHNKIAISSTPRIQAEEAIEKALQSLHISPAEWKKAYASSDDPSIGYRDYNQEPLKQTLVVYPFEGAYFLAWKVQLSSIRFNANQIMYVDAQMGHMLSSHSGKLFCEPGTAQTTWHGVQPINISIDEELEGVYTLHDQCGVRDINTLRAGNFGSTLPYRNEGTDWTYDIPLFRAGHTIHFSMTQAFKYFYDVHEQIGLHNDEEKGVRSVMVGFDPTGYNATADWIEIGWGDDFDDPTDDFTTIDICGHEFAHGVIYQTGGVTDIENYETVAVHEGMADIFGNEVEFLFEGGTIPDIDWSIGEERSKPPLRYIGSPNADIHPSGLGSPDTYLGDFWDGDHPQADGGVFRFWFFLLSKGGNGVNDNNTAYDVGTIGRDVAAEILYEAISSGSFGASPNYLTARSATLQAAVTIFGDCSYEKEQVLNAWLAVGVGDPDPDILLSGLSVNGPGNDVPTSGNFTVSYDLAASNNTFDIPNTEVGFYLRPDCSIVAEDIPFDVSVESIACGSTNSTQSTISLPTGTTPGTYRLIAKADAFNTIAEIVENNNTDCIIINVTDENMELPDFIPRFPSVSPSTVEAGNTVSTSLFLQNAGNVSSGTSYMCYYLSTDASYSSDDINLGRRYFSSLGPNTSSIGSKTLTIPLNTTPGFYYILYQADCYDWRAESNEDNNIAFNTITVTASSSNLPDLAITNVSPSINTGPPPFVMQGQSMMVSYTLENQEIGTLTGLSTTKIYLSLNNTVGSGDILVHTATSQAPGNKTASIQVPYKTMQDQLYYILIVADHDDEVAELDESNNVGIGYLYVTSGFSLADNELIQYKAKAGEDDSEMPISTVRNKPIQQAIDPPYEIQVFPNPTKQMFTLQYPVQKDQAISISLFNVTGQQLLTQTMEPSEQTGQWPYDGAQLPAGLYFIHCQTEQQGKVVKLVVE
ncbi:MAG: CARDB domain-containing protein [Bacteroidota bacterium]